MNSLPLSKGSGCILDCVPYDVLVSILQSPILDVHSIMLLAEVWPHYDELSMYVLSYYHLPRLHLESVMDQEGKRQYHSWFDFHSLDVTNRRVTFTVRPSISKRYISNTSTAARPHLRHITLHHNTTHQQYHSPIITPTSSVDLREMPCSAFSYCSLSVQRPDTIDTNKTTALHDFAVTMDTNMIQSHPLSLKQGFHTLSAPSSRQYQQKIKRNQRLPTTNSNVNKGKWQFSYRVSYTNDNNISSTQGLIDNIKNSRKKQKQHLKMEYMYLSPICLTVSLSTLRPSSASLLEQSSVKSSSWFDKYVKSKLAFL